MKTELYDRWIKSHRDDSEMPGLADAVMCQIIPKANRPNRIKVAWQQICLDFIQARTFTRTGVVACGALIGLIRMIAQVYSVLFT